jgi:hypothetical protein
MNSTVWVIIYSKYSPASNSLLDLITSSNIDVNFQGICIDNKEIRRYVQNSTKFNIQSVPCILHIDKFSGIVQQYEGQKAFEIVSSMIPAEYAPQEVDVTELIQPPEKEKSGSMLQTSLDDLGIVEDKIPEIQTGSVLKQKVSARDIMNTHTTSIDDIDKMPVVNIPVMEVRKTGKPINISEVMSEAQRQSHI